jgi:hypothetical protein
MDAKEESARCFFKREGPFPDGQIKLVDVEQIFERE